MGEILYKINNDPNYKSFTRNEKLQRIAYYIIILSMICYSAIVNFVCWENVDIWQKELLRPTNRTLLDLDVYICDFAPLCILITTIVSLMCYLDRYHNFERKRVQKSIILFGLFEIFDYSLTFSGAVLGNKHG